MLCISVSCRADYTGLTAGSRPSSSKPYCIEDEVDTDDLLKPPEPKKKKKLKFPDSMSVHKFAKCLRVMEMAQDEDERQRRIAAGVPVTRPEIFEAFFKRRYVKSSFHEWEARWHSTSLEVQNQFIAAKDSEEGLWKAFCAVVPHPHRSKRNELKRDGRTKKPKKVSSSKHKNDSADSKSPAPVAKSTSLKPPKKLPEGPRDNKPCEYTCHSCNCTPNPKRVAQGSGKKRQVSGDNGQEGSGKRRKHEKRKCTCNFGGGCPSDPVNEQQ